MEKLTVSLAAGLVVSIALMLTGSLARADDTAAAREHYQKGTAFYDLGKYSEAISEFEAAYQAKSDPALLYNLAQSHRLAGNAEQALHFYRTYLRYVPRAANRVEIEGRIASLEKLVEQKNVTQSTPPNQTIPPAPPSSPPAGGEPAVAFPPGGAGVPSAPPPALPAGGGAGAAVGPPSSPEPAAQGSDHPRKLILAGMVVGGAGVLAVIVGAAYGSAAKDAAHQVEARANMGGAYDSSVQAIDQRGRHDQTLEAAYLVIGVAALATGGFLYYYGNRQRAGEASAPPASVALLPSASKDRLGAALQVRF
jgi:tetratricopeptide (TPR) repeat protein